MLSSLHSSLTLFIFYYVSWEVDTPLHACGGRGKRAWIFFFTMWVLSQAGWQVPYTLKYLSIP